MDQQFPSIHVLVVDDSSATRDVLTQILECHGATVTAVDTAEHALALLEQLRPDVLLSDLEMPEKDGYWLISRVRALAADRGGLTPAACLRFVICKLRESYQELPRASFPLVAQPAASTSFAAGFARG